MKIAFILPSLANRGPIIFTQYLLKYLCTHEVEIEIFYFNDVKENILDLGVKTHKLSKYKKYNFSNFDIVHTTMAIPDLYASLFVPNDKWVCSMHNYLVEDVKMSHSFFKSKIITCLWKKSIKKCKNIIVSSKQMKQYYEKLLKNSNINYHLIPYGIYEKKYTDLLSNDLEVINTFKEKGFKIIGSVGLLISRKGFSQILKLVKLHEDLAAIIVGEGNERKKLEKEIQELNIADRVYLPGFRNNSHNFYNFFDIYGHVSYSEGFGLAMLEAMSKKIPIICSNLEIYRDFFSQEDVCLFEPGNIEKLNEAYCYIVQNMEKYSNASFSLFNKYFDVRVMSNRHIELYKKIIKIL